MALIFKIYDGPHTLDLASMIGKLVDIESGGMRGLRSDMEGFNFVVIELTQATAATRAAAGVPQDVYEHFVMCNETVVTVRDQLGIARKQVEVLEESLAYYIDARQNDIAMMVDSMKSRAQRRKDESVLVPFAQTLTYHSQIGDKAVRTRKQNAKARDEAEDSPPDGQDTSPAPAQPA